MLVGQKRPEGYHELRRIVAANLRHERQLRNWSLQQVADSLAPYLGRMGASTISSWENARHDGAKGFTIEEVYALCRVFKIRLAQLLHPPALLDMPAIGKLPGKETWHHLATVLSDDT